MKLSANNTKVLTGRFPDAAAARRRLAASAKRVVKAIGGLRLAAVAVLVMAAAMMAEAAVSDLPVTTVNGRKCYYYDVERESIYGVSIKLGVTRDQIIEYNPSAADGLKPKMRLFFPVAKFSKDAGQREAVYAAAAGISTHVVKRGETVYGIARKYGMSPDYLIRLNPWADEGIREGQTLRITDDLTAPQVEPKEDLQPAEPAPAKTTVKTTVKATEPVNTPEPEKVAEAPAPAETPATVPMTVIQPQATAVEEEPAREEEPALELTHPRKVAVLLPFMLNEEQQSRATQLYTEFFRGMLMGADTLRNNYSNPVELKFYDTEGSLETVKSILAKPELSDVNLIIAPDNAEQLEAIADYVDPDTWILNVFAVRNDLQSNHPNVIQANIPHTRMYDDAIGWFMEHYAGRTPVFISRNGGAADKNTFVLALQARLDEAGQNYRELKYDSALSAVDLEGISAEDDRPVFVPVSGSKAEFATYISAIKELRSNALDRDSVSLFGYPEWVTFRGETFDDLCDMGATIYSRFLVNENDYSANDLKRRYKELYGSEMFAAVPTQGLLGYDVAQYAIAAMRALVDGQEILTRFTGVQNSLDLRRDNPGEDAGLVNDNLFILTFSPGGIISAERR